MNKLAIGLAVLLSGCSSQPPASLGSHNGILSPCPARPNCVSSQLEVTDDHYITPFSLIDGSDWENLVSTLGAMDNIEIVTRQDNYLHAEATSKLFGFVDDLEFVRAAPQRLIHVRSASRIGYSDLGVNRDRIEQLRHQLNKRKKSK